jgi:glutamine synthetase
LRFADIPDFPITSAIDLELEEKSFEKALVLNGSSIPRLGGDQRIGHALDPDPNTAFLDPFRETATLVMKANVIDPVTGSTMNAIPVGIAQKGGAASAKLGPLRIRHSLALKQSSSSSTTSASSRINTPGFTSSTPRKTLEYRRAENNLGNNRSPVQGGYFPVPPTDHYMDLCAPKWSKPMIKCGLHIECHHHEVATRASARSINASTPW